jgi:hypothetical protein
MEVNRRSVTATLPHGGARHAPEVVVARNRWYALKNFKNCCIAATPGRVALDSNLHRTVACSPHCCAAGILACCRQAAGRLPQRSAVARSIARGLRIMNGALVHEEKGCIGRLLGEGRRMCCIDVCGMVTLHVCGGVGPPAPLPA